MYFSSIVNKELEIRLTYSATFVIQYRIQKDVQSFCPICPDLELPFVVFPIALVTHIVALQPQYFSETFGANVCKFDSVFVFHKRVDSSLSQATLQLLYNRLQGSFGLFR